MCLGRGCIGPTDNEPLFRQTNKGVKFLRTLLSGLITQIDHRKKLQSRRVYASFARTRTFLQQIRTLVKILDDPRGYLDLRSYCLMQSMPVSRQKKKPIGQRSVAQAVAIVISRHFLCNCQSEIPPRISQLSPRIAPVPGRSRRNRHVNPAWIARMNPQITRQKSRFPESFEWSRQNKTNTGPLLSTYFYS